MAGADVVSGEEGGGERRVSEIKRPLNREATGQERKKREKRVLCCGRRVGKGFLKPPSRLGPGGDRHRCEIPLVSGRRCFGAFAALLWIYYLELYSFQVFCQVQY